MKYLLLLLCLLLSGCCAKETVVTGRGVYIFKFEVSNPLKEDKEDKIEIHIGQQYENN